MMKYGDKSYQYIQKAMTKTVKQMSKAISEPEMV